MASSDEYEYEESTVMVELQGIIEADFLANVNKAKVLGIDTEKPLLQLDDYTFTGEYHDTVGTIMAFDEISEDEGKNKQLEFHCLANKKLKMQRVFLKSNEETLNDGNIASDSETDVTEQPSASGAKGNTKATTSSTASADKPSTSGITASAQATNAAKSAKDKPSTSGITASAQATNTAKSVKDKPSTSGVTTSAQATIAAKLATGKPSTSRVTGKTQPTKSSSTAVKDKPSTSGSKASVKATMATKSATGDQSSSPMDETVQENDT